MDISFLSFINTPTPVREIEEIHQSYGVRLFIKEDYLTHPVLSGNKWRKLEGNLDHIQQQNKVGIISFGGAHSNHLYALAGVRKIGKIPVVMLVRGDAYDAQNTTLSFAKESGVEIIFVDRASYRQKENSEIAKKIIQKYPNYFVIPEGGSNEYAFAGLKKLYGEINTQIPDFTHLALSMGTGGTAAGLLAHLTVHQKMAVYPSLKGDWMRAEILQHLHTSFQSNIDLEKQLHVRNQYHFGGYGKIPAKLIQFINETKAAYHLPLDPIYTGKAFFGLMEDIRNGYYPEGDTVIFLHTGGLRT